MVSGGAPMSASPILRICGQLCGHPLARFPKALDFPCAVTECSILKQPKPGRSKRSASNISKVLRQTRRAP